MSLPDDALLKNMAPRMSGAKAKRQDAIVGALSPVLASVLAAHALATPLRMAHFLAQACHESDGFSTTQEYWGPTPAQRAYEGRADLGNTQPGDGRRFMGRGIFQLTGRANYASMAQQLGLDLVAHPELAAEPAISLRIACAFWQSRKLNAPADRDDLEAVTRRINGGLNGLESRRACLRRAKAALAARNRLPHGPAGANTGA